MNDSNECTFNSGFEALLQAVEEQTVSDYFFFDIPSNRRPWFDTGMDVDAGDRLTSFATGQTKLKGTSIRLQPNFQLWFRIGPQGRIFRGTRDSHSFSVERSGRLYLASYFPGEWASHTGNLATPDDVYDLATGNLSVLLVRWRTDALAGLKKLIGHGDIDGLIANEIDRITAPVRTPHGWNYHWFTGPAEIYQACESSERESAICCHTHNDGGILQKSVALAFKPNTRLRWSWKIDRLPSSVREDSFPTHDYLSIAVEFDNGQDITYYWSAELPPETVFRCPIPTWTARETHVVIRSGTNGLGEWLNEERDIYQDYLDAIGGPPPASIVKVWLIAVSLFQRHQGQCQYSDIKFLTDDDTVSVL